MPTIYLSSYAIKSDYVLKDDSCILLGKHSNIIMEVPIGCVIYVKINLFYDCKKTMLFELLDSV